MRDSEIYTDASSKGRKEEAAVLTKKDRQNNVISIINKIFGFLLTTCILLGVVGLSFEYVLVKGPSPSLRDTFVMTMLETRRFGFLANIFLSDEEVAEIKSKNTTRVYAETDTSLINIPSEDGSGEPGGSTDNPVDYGLVDEDGDGIILEKVVKNTYQGYMLIVLDPGRVFVGKPDSFGGVGLTVENMCQKYDAIAGDRKSVV